MTTIVQNNRSARRLRRAMAAAVVFASVAAHGQLSTPVTIGCVRPVTDEFGVNLQGSATTPVTECDLVQVLWAVNGIEPPDVYGTPSTNNPPVDGGLSCVGSLTSPDLVNPGFFAISLYNPRLPSNSKIFVRVFNAPKRRDATFYADSQLLTVKNNNVLLADFRATTNAIDPRDDDGDNLNNSWETSLGSDLNNPDTDGDGMNDGDEFASKTDLFDPDSGLVTVQISPDADGNTVLAWESVTGQNYRVDFTTDDPALIDVSYDNVNDVITATDSVTQTTITNGFTNTRGQYRVRWVK